MLEELALNVSISRAALMPAPRLLTAGGGVVA